MSRKDISHLKKFLQPKREFILLLKLTPFQQFLYKLYLEKITVQFSQQATSTAPAPDNDEHSDDDAAMPELSVVAPVRGTKQGGFLFGHAKVGLLIWNHPLCLPLSDAARGEQRRKGSLTLPAPTESSLALELNDVYQAFVMKTPIVLPTIASSPAPVAAAALPSSDPNTSMGEEHKLVGSMRLDVDTEKEDDEEKEEEEENEVEIEEEEEEEEEGPKPVQCRGSEEPKEVVTLEDDFDEDLLEEEEDEMDEAGDVNDWWRNQAVSSNASKVSINHAAKLPSKEGLLGLGNKVVMLLAILSNAIDSGDKVVLFSQVRLQWISCCKLVSSNKTQLIFVMLAPSDCCASLYPPCRTSSSYLSLIGGL
jgi:SNF2 family DNA or RNA helicase